MASRRAREEEVFGGRVVVFVFDLRRLMFVH